MQPCSECKDNTATAGRCSITFRASTFSIGLSARCDTLVLPEGLYHLTNKDTDVAEVLRRLVRGACKRIQGACIACLRARQKALQLGTKWSNT